MTTTGTTERYPVRRKADGDFLLEEIARLRPATGLPRAAQPIAGIAEAALKIRIWEPSHAEGLRAAPNAECGGICPTAWDVELLHRVETSALVRPPVAHHVAPLGSDRARAWLTIAGHWISVCTQTGDLRFLNGACKLFGAVWSLDPETRWRDPELIGELGATARRLKQASDDLASRLSARKLASAIHWPGEHHAPITDTRRRPVTVILAGAGSNSPSRLLHAVRQAGGTINRICRYGNERVATVPSSYSEAWYPRTERQPAADETKIDIPESDAITWDQVAERLTEWRTGLLVLLGMPIVPRAVLAIPALGTINAHNGALPTYRGMDAVAWALLNEDPIVCSVHEVTAGIDAGPVLSEQVVAFHPGESLRARVKQSQVDLLTGVLTHAMNSGRLPQSTGQDQSQARQFYRLHPHLKRMLDASPYGTGDPNDHYTPSEPGRAQ